MEKRSTNKEKEIIQEYRYKEDNVIQDKKWLQFEISQYFKNKVKKVNW